MFELADRFTFLIPNHRHNPKVRAGFWDGKIKLLNIRTGVIYKGLYGQICDFCVENNYSIEYKGDFEDKPFTVEQAREFVATLKMPEKVKGRTVDERLYQLETFVHCVQKSRALFISPTSSGKSMMIYWLYRYYNKKTLIIVTKLNLLDQMRKDFVKYGYDENQIHAIFGGEDHDSDCPLIISTWQSIYKKPKKWFDQFEVVIGDEAHNYKATSLVQLLTSCNAPYRFGFTGSLDGTEINQLTLEGLFGQYKKIISTKELIDQGYATKLKVKALVLDHPAETRLLNKTRVLEYADEISFLIEHRARNKFIIKLADSLPKNGIILVDRIGRHGDILYEQMTESTSRPVYYVKGGMKQEEVNAILEKVNSSEDAILIASMKKFSEGVDLPNLHWGILAHPSKAKIGLIQRIGRGLRLADNKEYFTMYDIADDMSYKKKRNHTLLHFVERINIYNQEEHEYKIINVKMK